jgi:hypothetical protein
MWLNTEPTALIDRVTHQIAHLLFRGSLVSHVRLTAMLKRAGENRSR